MAAGVGPESLAHFEDKLLYHLVDLTGERPLGQLQGVSEADLAARMTRELGIEESFTRGEEFRGSETRETILAGVRNLEGEGLVEFDHALGVLSTIRPTSRGRRRVREWRDEWDKRQQQCDREIQRRILQDLDRIRRADPGNYQRSSHLDVGALCADLGITPTDFLANAHRLSARARSWPRSSGRASGAHEGQADAPLPVVNRSAPSHSRGPQAAPLIPCGRPGHPAARPTVWSHRRFALCHGHSGRGLARSRVQPPQAAHSAAARP